MKHVEKILACAGLATLVVQLVVWLPIHARRTDVASLDFMAYREAAACVANGQPLYDGLAAPWPGRPPQGYIYPPPLAVALAPFAGASDRAFQTGWYAFLLVAFWVYAAGLARLVGRPTVTRVFAAGLVLQIFPGTTVTMSFGNINVAVWAACSWALALESGPLAGAASAFKIYPAWLLLRRDWGAFWGVVVAVAILVATIPIVGADAFFEWKRALAIIATGPSMAGNVSLAHLLGARGAVAALAPAMAALSTSWLARGIPRRARGGLVLGAAVVFAPFCWWYYAPILLIPMAALLGSRAEQRKKDEPCR
jgi:hypothetical protein